MWELDHKEGWVLRNWCFQIVVLEKTLESPLDCKEIQPVNPKGNQSWIIIGRTDVEAEAPILWPPDTSSVQFSRSVVSDSLRPHELYHARLPCQSPTHRAYSNSCPLRRWCHLTISSSVIPFSSRLQSFPASGSFPMSQFFALGGQRIGASASTSVLPMNIQDWFPVRLTDLISLKTKGLSRAFFNTTV